MEYTIDAILAILTARQREAMEPRLEGFNHREIADRCGVQRAAVSRRLQRARERLAMLCAENVTK